MRCRMHRHIQCDVRYRHSPQRTHPRRRTHSRHRPLEPKHDPAIAHSQPTRSGTHTNSPCATSLTSELRGSQICHSARTRRLRSCNAVFAGHLNLKKSTRSGFSPQFPRHHRRNLEKIPPPLGRTSNPQSKTPQQHRKTKTVIQMPSPTATMATFERTLATPPSLTPPTFQVRSTPTKPENVSSHPAPATTTC